MLKNRVLTIRVTTIRVSTIMVLTITKSQLVFDWKFSDPVNVNLQLTIKKIVRSNHKSFGDSKVYKRL